MAVGYANMRSVTYADALLLLYELADKQDPRYGAAAARWHARFVLEARLPLGESAIVMDMLTSLLHEQKRSHPTARQELREFPPFGGVRTLFHEGRSTMPVAAHRMRLSGGRFPL
jgi:hypothetical protein